MAELVPEALYKVTLPRNRSKIILLTQENSHSRSTFIEIGCYPLTSEKDNRKGTMSHFTHPILGPPIHLPPNIGVDITITAKHNELGGT